MPIKTVIFDFDGTCTDVVQESAPFQPAYKAALADLLGRDVRAEWRREEEAILAAPEDYGWVYEGKVVAPATADPYLLATAIAQGIFDGAALLRNPLHRKEFLQVLYRMAYEQTLVAFRPDAREVFETLLASGRDVFVVTNSDGAAVAKKLEGLLGARFDRLRGRVFGNARKFWIGPAAHDDGRFAAVPATEHFPSLPRPIHLRRGAYFDALVGIAATTGAAPSETLLCGDIYELDLALPARLGYQVALVERANTLAYEREGVARAGGRVLPTLGAVLDGLG